MLILLYSIYDFYFVSDIVRSGGEMFDLVCGDGMNA